MSSARRSSIGGHTASGFTLIELIVVMVLIGVLAVYALPKLLDTELWRLRAFGDDLQSQMQAMLRMAMVQRRPIVATLTDSGVSFAYAGGAAIASLACPASATPCIAEGGNRLVTFNAGNGGTSITSSNAALPVTVSYGAFSQAYVLENETGLFYATP